MSAAYRRKLGLVLFFLTGGLSMTLFSTAEIQNSYAVLTSFAALFLNGAVLLWRFNYGRLSYGIPLTGYAFYVVPTLATGVFHGNDSWKYIRSAQMIQAEEAWVSAHSPFPHTHQFPGIQLYTVFISDILGLEIVTVARFMTPAVTAAVLLIVAVLARHLGASHRHAALAALLAASYYNLTAFSTYHHALFGFVFTFLAIATAYRYIQTERDGWGATFGVIFAALLVSHQYSTFVVAIILFELSALTLYQQDEFTYRYLENKAGVLGVLIVPGLLAAAYYLYIGQEFLEIFAVMAVLDGIPATPPPDPFLVDRLVLLADPPAWQRLLFGRHIQMAVVLGLSLLVVGYVWITEQRRRRLDMSLPVVLAVSIAAFGMMAVLGLVMEFISGIARNLRYAIPLIAALVIGLASRSMDAREAIRPLLIVLLGIFIVLSVSMYPGYLVGSGTAAYEHSYSIEMTGDHQASLDHLAAHRDAQPVVYGDTQSRLYFYMHDGTTATESYYPYAGRIDQEAYVIYRTRHEQILFLRGETHQYRVPAAMQEHYDDQWGKPYSAGASELYHADGNISFGGSPEKD